ncbi:MAG: sigma-70 family RNA polymerase sigma factor [Planctomycetota bacterium]
MSNSAEQSESDLPDGASRGPNEEFVRLFTQAQRSLYLFILPLVHTSSDAEEVLQETNVVILSKWHHFEPGTNFIAWCRAIARLEVFRFRRARHHKMKLLDDDVIELLMEQSDETPVDFEARRDALSDCIRKLKASDQDLIRRRYAAGSSGDDVAQQLGRPANSVYQSLGRVRRVLMDCIRRRMASGGVQ